MPRFIPGFTPPIVLDFSEDQDVIDKMRSAWDENPIEYLVEKRNFWLNSGDLNHVYGPKSGILLEKAKEFLTEHKFNFDPDAYHLEFHHTRVSKRELIESPFDWHIDDGSLMNCPVITIMFFVEKDPKMAGGNLFWNPTGKEQDEGKKLINIKTGSVIIMPGDTAHCPEHVRHYMGRFIGRLPSQERRLIEFQFKDLRRQIVDDEGL